MLLSVVSGTYNRLSYLKQMVASVRQSVGLGIPFEIVVVDGGSTDGTIEWCKDQPEIKLIEQGELFGAVKAFNAGAFAATGDYVILANDDITFVNHSIPIAIAFMQDNPDVGVGCFYQNRNGLDWHVEIMPVILDGVQINWYYGQVCIVPKFLGDEVGWWGDYLHTYGGDNELSCNVLELGYNVSPIECACIDDSKLPDDELRQINTSRTSNSGNHIDTETWAKRWTKHMNGRHMTGPIIASRKEEYIPVNSVVEKKLRVLYCPIYEPGYDIQKTTKKGLREALQKISIVMECDYVDKGFDTVYDLSQSFRPDIILTQIQSIGEFTQHNIRQLREAVPEAIFVNWNGDYHPEHLYDRNYIDMLKYFHLSGFVTTEVESVYDSHGIDWFYWQIGYEDDGNPKTGEILHDIVFLANGYSEERLELARTLRRSDFDVGLYGIWPVDISSDGTNLYNFEDGARLYKSSFIAIGDSQWPDARGFVSNRLFQAMAAGAFLLHQRFAGIEELLSLEDGKHLILWDSIPDLFDKLHFWLHEANDRKRARIAKAGQNRVLRHHSFDVRVQEMLEELKVLGYDIHC